MRETKPAWTRLSEQMPTEYPCLVRSVGKHRFGVEIFHVGGPDVAVGFGSPEVVWFFRVGNRRCLVGFSQDKAEWAPIPE